MSPFPALRAHGFYGTLSWFRCPRWLYHAIKALTSAMVAFWLICLDAPVLLACALAVVLTVPVPHLVERVKEGQPINLRDTVFDANCAALPLAPAAILALHGWRGLLVTLVWAVSSCALYVLLLARGWNSP